MFKRLKYGLFYPSKISELKNEKRVYTISFFFILLIISIVPNLLLINQGRNLNYEQRSLIKKTFKNKEIPYKLEEFQLTRINGSIDNLVIELSPSLMVIFDEDDVGSFIIPTDAYSIILFSKKSVYLVKKQILNTYKTKELFNYNKYNELENFDLSKAQENDIEFWGLVFPIINAQIGEMFYTNYVMNFLFYYLLPFILELLIFSLILTFFQRRFRGFNEPMRFSKLWQLMIYILLPYVVFRLFSQLYNIYILSFIGIIMSIIYASKLNGALNIRKDV